MARILLRSISSITQTLKSPFLCKPFSSLSTIPISTFDDHLLRLLRHEISYLSDYRRPYPPVESFKSFAIEDHQGQQWVRLRAHHDSSGDRLKIDATMFDGEEAAGDVTEGAPRRHLSLIVEVTRGDSVIGFVCSAWPDKLDVRRILPLRSEGMGGVARPYLGSNFE